MHQCYAVGPAELVDAFAVHIAVDRKEVKRRHFYNVACQDAVVRGALETT